MARANRSHPIHMYDKQKASQINAESKKLLRDYKKDMSLRELSPGTIDGYLSDLNQWLIYVLDNQDNRSVLELDEDDLTDFFYYCKSNGNNTRRMRRRYASISAFYKFLRKKRKIVENPMEFIDRPVKDNDVIAPVFYRTQKAYEEKVGRERQPYFRGLCPSVSKHHGTSKCYCKSQVETSQLW